MMCRRGSVLLLTHTRSNVQELYSQIPVEICIHQNDILTALCAAQDTDYFFFCTFFNEYKFFFLGISTYSEEFSGIERKKNNYPVFARRVRCKSSPQIQCVCVCVCADHTEWIPFEFTLLIGKFADTVTDLSVHIFRATKGATFPVYTAVNLTNRSAYCALLLRRLICSKTFAWISCHTFK